LPAGLEKTSFCIKKMIHCGDENEAAIPKPVGEGDYYSISHPHWV